MGIRSNSTSWQFWPSRVRWAPPDGHSAALQTAPGRPNGWKMGSPATIRAPSELLASTSSHTRKQILPRFALGSPSINKKVLAETLQPGPRRRKPRERRRYLSRAMPQAASTRTSYMTLACLSTGNRGIRHKPDGIRGVARCLDCRRPLLLPAPVKPRAQCTRQEADDAKNDSPHHHRAHPPSPIIGTWLASSSCVTCVFVTHLSDTNYHRRMQAGLAEPERAQRATSPLGPWAHIRHHGRKAVHVRRTEVPSQTRSRRGRARGARCRCSTATTWTAPTTTSAPPSSWRTSADSRPPNPSTARPRRRFDCQPDRRCAKTVKSG